MEQSAALAYRLSQNGPHVLLVTSRTTRRWVLPKGGIKSGHAAFDSAAIEAYEEAGIEGCVGRTCIGIYSYVKKNGKAGGLCVVRVYPLKVMQIHADWPERHQRRREWVNLPAASARVNERSLKKILLSFDAWLARGAAWRRAGHCP